MTLNRTRAWALAALLAAMALVMFAAVSQDRAEATSYPYEQTVCWEMDAPDLTNPASYEWPQHKVDCSVVPPASTSVCGPAAKYQVDTYWIRDDTDRDYLAGMTTMSSPADDGSDSPTTRNLEPHGYYAVLLAEKPAADCATPTPTPTPEPSPSVTPTPTPEPTPTTPPRDCRENPVTCPETPKPTPKPPTVGPAAIRSESHCLGNALVTTTEEYLDGEWQQTSTSSIEGARRCRTPKGQPPVEEEGY